MFKVKALETHKAVEAMMDIPLEKIKYDMVSLLYAKCCGHGAKDSHKAFVEIRKGCSVICFHITGFSFRAGWVYHA